MLNQAKTILWRVLNLIGSLLEVILRVLTTIYLELSLDSVQFSPNKAFFLRVVQRRPRWKVGRDLSQLLSVGQPARWRRVRLDHCETSFIRPRHQPISTGSAGSTGEQCVV